MYVTRTKQEYNKPGSYSSVQQGAKKISVNWAFDIALVPGNKRL